MPLTAPLIAQLLITFGPAAIQGVQQLIALWNKPSLTPEEVASIIGPILNKTPEQYLAEAKAMSPPTT